MEGIQPTYNMAQGDGYGFGGNGIWLFAILALFLFGNGGMWGNRGNSATTEDLATQSNFSRLENQLGNIGATVERKADGISNGICSLSYEMAQQFGATNTAIATGFCATDKAILESRYLNAQAIADSNAKVVAEINALSQKMDANKIESLQARINQLELAQATCGVVRYPNTTVYSSGCNPFCGCNCSGNI